MVFYFLLLFCVVNLSIIILLLCKFSKKKKREVFINTKLQSNTRRELSLFLDGECSLQRFSKKRRFKT